MRTSERTSELVNAQVRTSLTYARTSVRSSMHLFTRLFTRPFTRLLVRSVVRCLLILYMLIPFLNPSISWFAFPSMRLWKWRATAHSTLFHCSRTQVRKTKTHAKHSCRSVRLMSRPHQTMARPLALQLALSERFGWLPCDPEDKHIYPWDLPG